MRLHKLLLVGAAWAALILFGAAGHTAEAQSFVATPVAKFNEPWAMVFLPDGRLLVTEKRGALKVYTINGSMADITGVPKVSYGGQAGFSDIALHPNFATNGLVYFSYAEPGKGDMVGAAVARARLTFNAQGGGSLSNVQVIWRQSPKVSGNNHFSYRILFGADGHMFVTSGDRYKFTPAQELDNNLGKILRLNDDGTPVADNPFANRGGLAAQIWSYGHRNIYGLAFDPQGRLWSNEMGPDGGDELNLVERGSNYGWPIVSNGDDYDGRKIPDHNTQPKFNAPELSWNPVISPSSMIIYNASLFPQWRGNAFIGGLSSRGLVRVAINGNTAREAERLNLNQRIREVEQGPDGAIWVLEDEKGSNGGRLLRITPRT